MNEMFEAPRMVDKVLDAEQGSAVRRFGKITAVSGLVATAEGLPHMALGSYCTVQDVDGKSRAAEVVAVQQDKDGNGQYQLMPFGPLTGIGPGCKVYPLQQQGTIKVNNGFIGRILNALGEPIDGKGPLSYGGVAQDLRASPPIPSQRQPIGPILDTGVKVLNTMIPLCQGQRLGIFAGSGVGKSVLMSMLAKHSKADVNVIGLVGERGREVRDFVDQQLGPEGMAKTVLVVATSDEPPLMRRQAAYLTMSIAEYFRDCGCQVMLMLDSVTRFALAQREIGLASGEPPTTRGYTPSVFAELPKLLERAGPGLDEGSISAIFTVLVEGGDLDEPVADAVRGIVDGHIVLTRKLAERGHFPAVDVLQSISRMVPMCYSPQQAEMVQKARQYLSTYTDMEELIRLGAYAQGSDSAVDIAIAKHEGLSGFLKQHPDEKLGLDESFGQLMGVVG